MNETIKPVYTDLPMMAEEKMTKMYPKNTICQMIRTIYGKTEDEEIKILCRIAALMAKKMDDKLREHDKFWDYKFWL